MKGHDAERLAGVLAQCPAMAHLDLRDNFEFGAEGPQRLPGALVQCPSLTHLNLRGNMIRADDGNRDDATERLTAAWRGPLSGLCLDEDRIDNSILMYSALHYDSDDDYVLCPIFPLFISTLMMRGVCFSERAKRLKSSYTKEGS
jgi:Ran GTPase-activating protein (RanGAP) involved in mRNA processing and transport